MTAKYLFIVGLPRTGTKLVESILHNARAVDYQTSGETFFFGHFISPGVRDRIKKIGDLRRDDNVHRLVEYLYSGAPSGGYWKRLKSGSWGVERDTLQQAILASDRSDREIYKILLTIHAPPRADVILGDKTPAHLYHVPTVVAWFPNAKVVHTFRDPRAILASEWKKRMERVTAAYIPFKPSNPLYSLTVVLHVTATWLSAARLHRQYARRYPRNYYLLKFEDLISAPEHNVRRLCEFLEIEYEAAMLLPRQKGSSYERSGKLGFDPQALTRWQGALKPWMKTWLTFWGRKYLREFGYTA